MNILYEYVLFCEVAIHHGRAAATAAVLLPSLRPFRSLSRLSGGLGTFTVELDEFNYTLWRGGGGVGVWMDGWTDGEMDDRKEGMEKSTFSHIESLSLPLMAAVINRAPALDGDASETNTAAANSYHDFCSNWSAFLMFI